MEENVGKSFKAPQTRIAPMNLGGEKKRNMNAGKQDQNRCIQKNYFLQRN